MLEFILNCKIGPYSVRYILILGDFRIGIYYITLKDIRFSILYLINKELNIIG